MSELIEVCKVGEVEPGQARMIEAEGREIAIFNCAGEIFALDNECTHVGGPLCDGEIEGCKVICPWHGAEFDIRTGRALAPPAGENVKSYRVIVEDGVVKVVVE
jgi:3-phenylpropionate/trans-cinnamate dioxygenase ferredoxin subunit